MENGKRSEEQMNSEPLWSIRYTTHTMTRGFMSVVTISGISKFRQIVKLVLWVLGVQGLHYMLKRIFHSPRHPPLCGSPNLKVEM